MTERSHHAIPAGLDEMEPGPALAAFLASIDVSRVSPHDRVTVLRAEQRMASYFQARAFAAMAAVADHYVESDPDADLAWDGAATEIRCALRLTRRSAESELDLATDLRDRLPRVLAALEAGDLDRRRAGVLAKETAPLTDDVARGVVDSIIDDAAGLTTGQLAARVRRLAQQANAEAAEKRYHSAVQNRRVVVEATPDGTADLIGLDLPPHRVAAAKRRINRIALDIKTSTEDRTMDQIRADVFLDLLEGAPTSSKDSGRACVDIRVSPPSPPSTTIPASSTASAP